jgi:hypothetical protein
METTKYRPSSMASSPSKGKPLEMHSINVSNFGEVFRGARHLEDIKMPKRLSKFAKVIPRKKSSMLQPSNKIHVTKSVSLGMHKYGHAYLFFI